MPHHYFIMGCDKPKGLIVKDHMYFQLDQNSNGNARIIQCDIVTKTMRVYERDGNCAEFQESTKGAILKGVIIDLSSQGERWEGDSFLGKPIGYGCYFNECNILSYCGFVFNGVKVCFGTEFYPDSTNVEYRGGFYNGRRHGFGIYYNRKSECVYSGNWLNGTNTIPFYLSTHENCHNSGIHSLLKELRIGDNSLPTLSTFYLVHFVYLKKVIIGSNCCKEVNEVVIDGCEQLESIIIGEDSFNNYPDWIHYYRDEDLDKFMNRNRTLTICNCPLLKQIQFHPGTFVDYAGKFELRSLIFPYMRY